MQSLPATPRLPSPFMRCPVCGGTTSLGDHYERGIRHICSVCYSCDCLWDLRGNLIRRGKIVRLPLVHNLTLVEDDAEYNPALKPRRRPGQGRPFGARDSRPRKKKENLI